MPKQEGRGELISIYVRRHSFRGTAQPRVDIGSFTVLSVGTLKYPQCIQRQLKIQRHFTNAFLLPVKPS